MDGKNFHLGPETVSAATGLCRKDVHLPELPQIKSGRATSRSDWLAAYTALSSHDSWGVRQA